MALENSSVRKCVIDGSPSAACAFHLYANLECEGETSSWSVVFLFQGHECLCAEEVRLVEEAAGGQ